MESTFGGIKLDKFIGSKINGGNTAYKRSDKDFYPTPPEVTKALIDFLSLPKGTVIWEPACGEGNMAKEFEKNGFHVKK